MTRDPMEWDRAPAPRTEREQRVNGLHPSHDEILVRCWHAWRLEEGAEPYRNLSAGLRYGPYTTD